MMILCANPKWLNKRCSFLFPYFLETLRLSLLPIWQTFQGEDAISEGVNDVIERRFIGHIEKEFLFGFAGDGLDLFDEHLWVLLPTDVMTENLEASVRERGRGKDNGWSWKQHKQITCTDALACIRANTPLEGQWREKYLIQVWGKRIYLLLSSTQVTSSNLLVIKQSPKATTWLENMWMEEMVATRDL